ncbi:unnamed protein product [Withania somnifera]
MSKFWALLSHLHDLAGPVVMLLYPLYASVVAIESTSKLDDEQWLAYWILYSFLTLMEMVLQPILQWGAAFIYDKFVREKLIKKYGSSYIQHKSQSPNGKPKNKIVDFITLKKGEH